MNDIGTPSLPRFRLPAGACDCHMHAYGDERDFPADPASPFPPVAGGSMATYLAVRARLGLTRAVVVQPSVYGFDNRCTLDAIAQLGADGRGVAVVPPDVDDVELQRLSDLGIRGLRFFMLPGGALPWSTLPTLAAKIAPFGWHIQLQTDGRFLSDHLPMLNALPCPLVIDHNGKFLEPVDPAHEEFQALLGLIERGRTWVKVSGVYETSRLGLPDYADVALLARTLIAKAPERCLFATNWPHPSKPKDPPNDGLLIDLFHEWCGSDAVLRQVLVENPQTVYGFEPVAQPVSRGKNDA